MDPIFSPIGKLREVPQEASQKECEDFKKLSDLVQSAEERKRQMDMSNIPVRNVDHYMNQYDAFLKDFKENGYRKNIEYQLEQLQHAEKFVEMDTNFLKMTFLNESQVCISKLAVMDALYPEPEFSRRCRTKKFQRAVREKKYSGDFYLVSKDLIKFERNMGERQRKNESSHGSESKHDRPMKILSEEEFLAMTKLPKVERERDSRGRVVPISIQEINRRKAEVAKRREEGKKKSSMRVGVFWRSVPADKIVRKSRTEIFIHKDYFRKIYDFESPQKTSKFARSRIYRNDK